MKSVDKVKNIGMTLFIVSALVTLFISNEISKLSYGLALVMLLLEIISHSLNIKILQPKAYNAINNKAMKLVKIGESEIRNATNYAEKLRGAQKIQEARKMVGADYRSNEDIIELEELATETIKCLNK